MSDPLGVLAVGLFCPVGLDTEQTLASIDAGLTRKRRSAFTDERGEPIALGMLPDDVLPPLVTPLASMGEGLPTRLLRLLTPALHEVTGAQVDGLEAVAGVNEPRYSTTALPRALPLGLVLAVPSPPEDSPPWLTAGHLTSIALQAGVAVEPALSHVVHSGRAGLFEAMRFVQTQVFGPGRAEVAILGGVDSYACRERLALLEQQHRLLTSHRQDAFTPGEAAACLLVAPRLACRRHGLSPLAWVESVGLAHEPGHVYSPLPHRGDGLAHAVRLAVQGRPAHRDRIAHVLAGMNGETTPAKAWGVARLRNRDALDEAATLEHPAEFIGDCGAALAPLMLGLAARRLSQGVFDAPTLVWASADHGPCGALIVRPAKE